jgi:hypothetical protein
VQSGGSFPIDSTQLLTAIATANWDADREYLHPNCIFYSYFLPVEANRIIKAKIDVLFTVRWLKTEKIGELDVLFTVIFVIYTECSYGQRAVVARMPFHWIDSDPIKSLSNQGRIASKLRLSRTFPVAVETS